MERVYDKCCGVEVDKKFIAACFQCGKKQAVRDFGATTRESIASYWKLHNKDSKYYQSFPCNNVI